MNKQTLALLMVSLVALCGCSTAINGVKHRELSVYSQVARPVILSPVCQGAKVFVQVTNTTNYPVNLTDGIKESLAKRGAIIVNNPKEAQLIVGANLTYFGKALYINPLAQSIQGLQEMQMAGQTAGLVASAGNAARMGASGFGALGIASGVTLAAGAASKGMSLAVEVKEYAGVVDLEISEKETGKVHATRLVVTVKQTNLQEDKALTVIQAELAALLTKLFPAARS